MRLPRPYGYPTPGVCIGLLVFALGLVALVMVAGYLAIRVATAMPEQTTVPESLTTLQQFYDLVRNYRIEVVLTLMVVGNWIGTFLGTQLVKRRLRILLKRQLKDGEVWTTVYAISVALNALLWWAFIPDFPLPPVVVITVFAALTLERSVNSLMDWAYQGEEGGKRKAFYHWMRNDRRGPGRNGKKPPDYFLDDNTLMAQRPADGAEDMTEPK